LRKADDLGLDLSRHGENGLLEIIWQPTGALIMDALAERLFDSVRRRKVKRLVIDSISGSRNRWSGGNGWGCSLPRC